MDQAKNSGIGEIAEENHNEGLLLVDNLNINLFSNNMRTRSTQ